MKKPFGEVVGGELHFRRDWLLRTIKAIVIREALFAALKNVGVPEFRQGLKDAETSVDTLLSMVVSCLGPDMLNVYRKVTRDAHDCFCRFSQCVVRSP